jgi:hypothetical protein
MMLTRRAALLAALVAAGLPSPARGEGRIRIGTLKFGSVNWMLDTIAAEDLDKREVTGAAQNAYPGRLLGGAAPSGAGARLRHRARPSAYG